MDRTREVFRLGYAGLNPDAVAAIGAIRWLSGLASPELEACPQGLSPEAARHLAHLLGEYQTDPLGWCAYFEALEGVVFS